MSRLLQLFFHLQIFQCLASRWTELGDLLSESSASAVGVYDSNLYLIGGKPSNIQLTKYTIDTDTLHPVWNAIVFPSGTTQFYTQQQQIVYMISSTSTLATFNLATRTYDPSYTSLESEVGYSGFACLTSSNDYLYVTGGRDIEADTYLDTLQIFDLSHTQWTEPQNKILEARGNHACVVHNDYLYVIGGYDGNSILKSIERIPSNSYTEYNTWEPTSITLRFAVMWARAISNGDKIYLFGGQKKGTLAILQIIDIIGGSTALDSMPVALNAMAAIYVELEEAVYIFGGRSGSVNSDVVLRYYIGPTSSPTEAPTQTPTTGTPTRRTVAPTMFPSHAASDDPTRNPSDAPTLPPTNIPSLSPLRSPTQFPSVAPTTSIPTKPQTDKPSNAPSGTPISAPTEAPAAPTDAHTDTKTTEEEDGDDDDRHQGSVQQRGILDEFDTTQLAFTITLLILTVILCVLLCILIYWRHKRELLIKNNLENINKQQQSIYGEPNEPQEDGDITIEKEYNAQGAFEGAGSAAALPDEEEENMLAQILAISLAEEEERKKRQIEMMKQYERKEVENVAKEDENVRAQNDDADSQSAHDSDDDVLKTGGITVGNVEIVDDYKQDAEDAMDNPASGNYYKKYEDILALGTEHSGMAVNADTDSDDDVLAGHNMTIGGAPITKTVAVVDEDDFMLNSGDLPESDQDADGLQGLPEWDRDLPESDSDDDVLIGANINVTLGGAPALPTYTGNVGESLASCGDDD